MKPKLKTILSVSTLTILVFMTIALFQNTNNQDRQIESSQQVLPQNYQALLPKKSDNPLGSGEEVSFAQAQKKISYSIPLPEAEKIRQVWVRTNSEYPLQQSVAIRFKKDLLLIVHVSQNETPTNWDKVIAYMPEFKKVEINGIPGMGAAPGVTEIKGQPYNYPGSVAWWLDGLDITLYSDTLSLEELLKIAETIKSANPPHEQTETPTNSPAFTETLVISPAFTKTPSPTVTSTETPIETPVERPSETPLPTETPTP